MAKDYNLPRQDMIDLIPQNLRNPMVTSLVDNLFNRFLTKDEAIPLYGYVGRKPTASDDKTPKVPQPTVERDINGLVPVLSFSVGSEVYSFTVQDLVRKAEVLGISADQSSWLYSQGNNYAPPIDLLKFTNFFNYYWVARAIPNPPLLDWNPSLAPEYYTIARPLESDLDKLNVVTATNSAITLTGTGFLPQIWTVLFSSATTFTVKASGGGLPTGEDLQGPFVLPVISTQLSSVFQVNFNMAGQSTPLLSFKIVRDPVFDGNGAWAQNETFAAGDQFTIVAPFISSTYSITPNVGLGVKGKITAVNSLDLYQHINGVRPKENARVLVKNQGTSSENGIYIVKAGAFVRATDFNGSTAIAGVKVFDTNAKVIYVSAGPAWQFQIDSSNISNTNDWQESNFWIHRDQLQSAEINAGLAIQATRPIIEYHANLVLNSHFTSAGIPANTGNFYEQRKTEFNQTPLFNVYRYDGTHAGRVSPIFFYREDPTAAVDIALQRRVSHATNLSSDFVFEHGLIEAPNTLLFYERTTPPAPPAPPPPPSPNLSISDAVYVGDVASYTFVSVPNIFGVTASDIVSAADSSTSNIASAWTLVLNHSLVTPPDAPYPSVASTELVDITARFSILELPYTLLTSPYGNPVSNTLVWTISSENLTFPNGGGRPGYNNLSQGHGQNIGTDLGLHHSQGCLYNETGGSATVNYEQVRVTINCTVDGIPATGTLKITMTPNTIGTNSAGITHYERV